jgi:lipoprotein-anchoring transpeptidase ErfK/SrfK
MNRKPNVYTYVVLFVLIVLLAALNAMATNAHLEKRAELQDKTAPSRVTSIDRLEQPKQAQSATSSPHANTNAPRTSTVASNGIESGQAGWKAQDSVKPDVQTLAGILQERGITPDKVNLTILVNKTNHTLSLYQNQTWLKSYHTEFGDSGMADKLVSGDHKTPEGTFYIAQKQVLSPADPYLGTRWMRLSYPNAEDANRGIAEGLISQETYNEIVYAINNHLIPPQQTALGGGVGIHGGTVPSLGSNWTWGCVGLTNKDVEDFYDYVQVGTQVIIQH